MHGISDIDPDLSRAFISKGTLPAHIDSRQFPIKQEPFRTINNAHFIHSVEILLPRSVHEHAQDYIARHAPSIGYQRIIISLTQLLEGDFFNEYIKKGNILMISEGRPAIDTLYRLVNGRLRIELSKSEYERTGLQGRPISDRGRKHVPARYAIEIDLRDPSMVRGRKGFERIVYACKNVFTEPVKWLFHDLDGQSNVEDDKARPIASHDPVSCISQCRKLERSGLIVPPFHNITSSCQASDEFEDQAQGLYEWLGLVSLGSARVEASDQIDPFLSRYRVGVFEKESDMQVSDFVLLKWSGLLPVPWIRDLFAATSNAVRRYAPAHAQVSAFTAHCFLATSGDTLKSYTILIPPCPAPLLQLPEAQPSESVPANEDPISEKMDMDVNAQPTTTASSQPRVKAGGRPFILWRIQTGE